MLYIVIIVYMALFGRLSGSGFGSKWGVSWLPELFFSIPFGLAFGWALYPLIGLWSGLAGGLACAWSYGFMQAATWMFLKWTSHTPNSERSSTLKPIVDWIAKRFGYALGDEGYSWIAAGVKGFLIGLPVGGLPLAILWPLGYEIGSHVKGQHKDAAKEIAASAGAGIAIVIFIIIIKTVRG